jgi:hypothetical protein
MHFAHTRHQLNAHVRPLETKMAAAVGRENDELRPHCQSGEF